MATPAVKNIKEHPGVHTSQDVAVAEPAPAGASMEAGSESKDPILAHEEISRLAYSYWETRGCEAGSAEEDWYRAEAELRGRAG